MRRQLQYELEPTRAYCQGSLQADLDLAYVQPSHAQYDFDQGTIERLAAADIGPQSVHGHLLPLALLASMFVGKVKVRRQLSCSCSTYASRLIANFG
jgi:hypothetical protein